MIKIKFLDVEKSKPIDIYRLLVNVYGDEIVNASTFKRCFFLFQSSIRGVRKIPLQSIVLVQESWH